MIPPRVHESWNDFFNNFGEFELPNCDFLPANDQVFRVFEESLDNIKIILIAQDPYSKPSLADGLAFSTPNGSKIPGSLRNLFTEIENTFEGIQFKHGDLTRWSKNGIFLLNTALTVKPGISGSHSRYWLNFTKSLIEYLDQHLSKTVFVFFGNKSKHFAQSMKAESNCNVALFCKHPSPNNNGIRQFVGCGIFETIDSLCPGIDWQN
jgi:uracil-DNA glycosylase